MLCMTTQQLITLHIVSTLHVLAGCRTIAHIDVEILVRAIHGDNSYLGQTAEHLVGDLGPGDGDGLLCHPKSDRKSVV